MPEEYFCPYCCEAGAEPGASEFIGCEHCQGDLTRCCPGCTCPLCADGAGDQALADLADEQEYRDIDHPARSLDCQ